MMNQRNKMADGERDWRRIVAGVAGGGGGAGAGAGVGAGAGWVELIDHIVAVHHARVREQLAELNGLIEEAMGRHARGRPGVPELARLYREFKNEIVFHLLKEEQRLFPAVRQLAEAHAVDAGDVRGLVAVLRREHSSGNEAVARMWEVARELDLPGELQGRIVETLGRVEEDLRQHVHEEDEVLFPAVVQALGRDA